MSTLSMSQSIQGDRNIQILVERSKNVIISVNGQRIIELETPPYPRPLPDKLNEIDLLKAAHAQIPFLGRELILHDFIQWCEDPPAVSFRTLVGQGGSGKTRFAYELYARVNTLPHWSAYFLHFQDNSAKRADLWSEIKSKNALLIADYASDSATPIAHLLQPLTNPAPEGRRIRILLLARTASWEQGWLASLASGRTGEDVDRYFHPREPIPLTGFTVEQRHAIFTKMVETAANRTGKRAPALPPLERFREKDVAERLADPLTLMMAALIALESNAAGALSLKRTELAHDVAHKLVAERMKTSVEDHRHLFLHMAAYATLIGGLSEHEALAALEEESNETKLGAVSDPHLFLEKLQAWLPGETSRTWLGTVEPDIVGEAFVLGQGARSYLRAPEQAVLRAARRRAAPTINTVIRTVQDFSFSATDSRVEPLQWLTTLVEQGEADNDLSLLIEISDAMPESSVVLREIGFRISTALCSRLPLLFYGADEGSRRAIEPLLATSLNDLANRLAEVGQPEAALKKSEIAVGWFRELAVRNRDDSLPGLARSLYTLASLYREVGKWEAALAAAKEAADLYRELSQNRDAVLPELAASLQNLARCQSSIGQWEAALAAAKETVDLYRELAGRNIDTVSPNLALSLNSLAAQQSYVGQHEAALATAQEAVGLRRELVDRNSDAFLPDLTISLNTLAIRQRKIGQCEAALATAQEAVELCRDLVERNRDAFVQNLARSCWTLADVLYDVGRAAEAQSVFAEAIQEVLREVPKHPPVYVPLCAELLRECASKVQTANTEPDFTLLVEAAKVLRPYFEEKGE